MSLDALIASEIAIAPNGTTYSLEGEDYARVTAILHKVLPPFLSVWAEKVGIQAAHEVYRNMNNSLPTSWEDTRHVARQMGIDIEGQKEAGGKRGAESHFALESWIKQGIPPSLEDFEPEHRPYAQTLCAFLVETEPEFECSELTVWHPELGYAGTIDAIGKITKKPARCPNIVGKRFAWDLKSNQDKRIYVQHYMQLAAYRLCLDYHGIEVDGEAVIAIGPSPWKNSGSPFSVGVNYVPARLWPPIVNAYRALEEARNLNPRSRS